jgi:peroxin-14
MIQSNKEAQTAAIVDLQTELKSLKSLMAARPGPSSIPSLAAPSSSGISPRSPPNGTGLNSFGIQPQSHSLSKFSSARPIGIPTWQLASGYNVTTSNSQTHNGDPSSNQTGSSARPSGSGSSPRTTAFDYTNGDESGKLNDNNRSGYATPERNPSRHSLVEDEDDHIINSKYTTDDQN